MGSIALQYEKYAWGMDELQPLSMSGKNSFAGMGATVLDSLSTLWIMGLKDEFARGRAWVNSSLVFPRSQVRWTLNPAAPGPAAAPCCARRRSRVLGFRRRGRHL